MTATDDSGRGRLRPPKLPEAVRLERAQAMLGLYYQAYKGREGFELPPEIDSLPLLLQPVPIAAAAETLGRGDDHDIELRRRRAVATLVAGGRNADPAFESIVNRIYPDLDPALLPGLLDPGVTVDWIYAHLGPASCICSDIQRQIERRPGYPLVTDCTVSATVNKKVKPVCDALDPQNWTNCSDYFVNVYPAAPANGQYPGGGAHDPAQGPSPGSPGTPWSDVVFEHFWMPWNTLSMSWFRNYLAIETHATAGSGFRVDYRLKRAIGSRVGLVQQDGGLDVDSGSILIEALGASSTRVTMTKSVRFTDRTPKSTAPLGSLDFGETLNYLAPFMLVAQLEEAVCDTVCCG